MKTIEELLKNLARPEVLEFGLVTNRLPSVNIGGKFEPVDDEAPGNDRLFEMLHAVGGAKHLEGLSEKPMQWTTRLDGVGMIAVAAIMRKDVMQARFTVVKRDTSAKSTPSMPARPPIARTSEPRAAIATPVRTSEPRAAVAMPARNSEPRAAIASPSPQAAKSPTATGSMPRQVTAKPVPMPTGPQPVSAPPIQPQTIQNIGTAAPAPPISAPEPAEEEWDNDDDEPTLQTLSPPVEPPPNLRAKPEGVPIRKISTPTTVDIVDLEKQKAAAAARASAPPQASPAPPPVQPPAQPQASPPPAPVTGKLPSRAPAAPPPELGVPDSARTQIIVQRAPENKDLPRVDPSAPVDTFLQLAVATRASDLFLVPGRPVLLRFATELLPRTQPIPTEHVERIAKELVPTRLRDALEKDGSCEFAIEHPTHGRFRVDVVKQRLGMMLNFRVIPREVATVAALGLPDVFTKPLGNASGLVLVAAPSGHGKSTTLAALVDHVNRDRAVHIVTLEEPIEHVHTRKRALVTQRDLGLHVRRRGRALASVLREDCDVLVIADLRDADTARLALTAAEGGRLVLATLNLPTTPRAIEGLVDLLAPPERAWARSTVAQSLRMVMGQRLVASGDKSRIYAASEIVPWTPALADLVREGQFDGIADALANGKAAGVLRLEETLADLVRTQRVTLEAAQRVAPSAPALDRLLKDK